MIWPQVVNIVVQASVGHERIKKFFALDDVPGTNTADMAAPHHSTPLGHSVVAINSGGDSSSSEGVSFRWRGGLPGTPPTLQRVVLQLEPGSLTAVIGECGSGKSTLLSAILGEVPAVLRSPKGVGGTSESFREVSAIEQHRLVTLAGKDCRRCKIGYAAQRPFIRNCTLKENIVMGDDEVDQEAYRRVIEACALSPDIALLPAGDETEIGEKGVNLSGEFNFTRLLYD